MILTTSKPNIERSSDFEETLFSIGDTGLILDILRNRMYSNPILAVCREITCNARDAHREAKISDVPIEITLPTTLEPNYRVKDFGPGISPSRIKDVYTQYGASTKREDNVQLGGFGIGAKTPWSVSSGFTVQTIVDGFQYNYCCYIDESNIGKISLLDKFSTDSKNGTTIIIPINAKDFRAFEDGTEFVCRHWDIKPIIKNADIKFKTLAPIFSGEGWSICRNDEDYYQRAVKLIIDGIEYPVDVDALNDPVVTKLTGAIYGVFYLTFGIGELSLSANRETIHLDKATRDKVVARLQLVSDKLAANVQTKIDECANLWDANAFYHNKIPSMFINYSFLGKLKWQGIDLHRNELYLDHKLANVCSFSSSAYKGKRSTNKYNSSYISFPECCKLYLNDIGVEYADLSKKNVEKAFIDDPTLSNLFVISLVDKTTWKDLDKKYDLDKMAPGKLSEIVSDATDDETPAVKKKTAPRLDIFKLDVHGQVFRRSSLEAMEEDLNTKVFCSINRPTSTYRSDLKYDRYALYGKNKTILNYTLAALVKALKDVSIYGTYADVSKAKVEENCIDVVSLDDYLDKELTNNAKIDFLEVKNASSSSYYCGFMKDFGECTKKITNKDSVFLEYLALEQRQTKLIEEHSHLLAIYETINGAISDTTMKKWSKDNPDKNEDALKDKLYKTYPLLKDLNSYYTSKEAVVEYINLIDAK